MWFTLGSSVLHSNQQIPDAGDLSAIGVVTTTHFWLSEHWLLLVHPIIDEPGIVSQLKLMPQNPSPSVVYRHVQQLTPCVLVRSPQANAGSRKPGETGTHRHSPWAVGATVKAPRGQVVGQTPLRPPPPPLPPPWCLCPRFPSPPLPPCLRLPLWPLAPATTGTSARKPLPRRVP